VSIREAIGRTAKPGILIPVLAVCCLFAPGAFAQETAADLFGIDLPTTAERLVDQEGITTSLTIIFLITILSLAPALLLMTTCFTRIIVVLGFLRQALATQQTPPNQVLVGLALFLSLFIMMPTYQEVNDEALQPYIRGELDGQQAIDRALIPIRDFMFRQTRPADIRLFLDLARLDAPETREDVPTHVLIPAFVLSELTTAFQIGFIIYIPFLIIDMVVASTLMAMGMMMLPPIFVSLPFKIIMFVLADGWRLLVGSLAQSFQ